MHPYNSACIHKRDLYLVLKPQPFFLSILWLTLCLCHRCTQQHTCPPRKPMHTACHPSRHTLSICSNCTSPAVCSLGTHSKLTAGLLPLTPPCLPRSAGPPWRAASAWPVQPRGTLGHSLPERCLVSICNAVRICMQLLSLEGVPMAPPSCHHRQGCTCVTACASGMHASSAGCLLLPSALHAVLLGISNNRSTFSFDGFCFWCQIYELCLTPGMSSCCKLFVFSLSTASALLSNTHQQYLCGSLLCSLFCLSRWSARIHPPSPKPRCLDYCSSRVDSVRTEPHLWDIGSVSAENWRIAWCCWKKTHIL
ncbi:PREDICTED: uncharacterized protein LOC109375638 [Hipposideros armiger]|uniref:Uncharacterized protein LOC109375638 n=1 Tax=Hipposideros armiger TaxID=186990 RepID=A0A8B7QDQ8_HIPAR|nr:PREDICTED: uncharacterized protein LOC109375638 [Hipposideros armiger]